MVWATLFPGVSPCGDPPSRANRPAAKAPVLVFAKNLVLFGGVSKDTMASVRAKRKTRQKLRFRRRGAVLVSRGPENTVSKPQKQKRIYLTTKRNPKQERALAPTQGSLTPQERALAPTQGSLIPQDHRSYKDSMETRGDTRHRQ